MANCSCVNAFPGSLPSSGVGGAQVFRRYTGVGANPTPESVTVQLVSTCGGGRRASSSRFEPAHTGSRKPAHNGSPRLSRALGVCGSLQKPLARLRV